MRLTVARAIVPLIALTAAKETNTISSVASQAASAASSISSAAEQQVSAAVSQGQDAAAQATAAAAAQYNDLSALVSELVIGKGMQSVVQREMRRPL